ncbi:MAG: PDZ domain-containing protein [Cyanobium sp. PLM2.Bin73]|nr:MAG: PDZ domain-containing protein [Cyanobium sp. PLM2.Bin73]
MGSMRNGLVVLVGLGACAATAVMAREAVNASSGNPRILDSPKEVIDQTWQIVFRDFLDINGQYTAEQWKQLRREMLARSYATPSDAHEAIRGMLATLDDPYTRFLDPREFKEMQIDTSGELSGVGIQLSLDQDTKELVVVAPIKGSPASRAGVLPKDVITAIDGQSTKGMSTEDAVRLIRGQVGTTVTLTLRRNTQTLEVPLTRDRIELQAVDHQINVASDGTRIGYIRLKQFNANATKDMRAALRELEKQDVAGYVIDLRSNPGGLLMASVEIARQLLNEGTIVSTQTRRGIVDVQRANGRALTQRPIVVLVNEGSASASEILSGALQDNNRAVLVGQKTFGKGLVQSVRSLSDGSGMTVTIARYLTPSGRDINKNGIEPDVKVAMSEREVQRLQLEDIGTRRDSQYRVAENTLVEQLQTIGRGGRSFKPGSANVPSALPTAGAASGR